MEIVLYILLFICIVGIIFSTYMAVRNFQVRSFRYILINMACDYEMRRLKEPGERTEENAFNWFLNKYSYEDMLFSCKPLRLEKWYTEEELTEINR
nr:MAG TPA: Sporulation protein YhaL [Caudoviricetes sp.]